MVREVVVWDLATGKANWRAQGRPPGFQAFGFSKDSMLIAHGDEDGVRLLNAARGTERRRLEAVKSFVHCLARSPDGHTLAGASREQHTGNPIFAFGSWRRSRSAADSRATRT